MTRVKSLLKEGQSTQHRRAVIDKLGYPNCNAASPESDGAMGGRT